jgi:hypothetical protein
MPRFNPQNRVSLYHFLKDDVDTPEPTVVSSLSKEDTPDEIQLADLPVEFEIVFRDVAIDNSVNGGRGFALRYFARSMVSSAVGFGKKLFS